MRLIKSIARLGSNQFKNLINIAAGRPLTTPSLGSMTLDQDDVDIARTWLQDRANWGNLEIVRQYEIEFAHWNGSKYAFAFMSGREALSACIYALELQPGDEVILPGYTCVVVPNAFHYAGVKAVYCDIELDTYGPDVADVKKKITPKTRAILLHHLYGLVCRDYETILDLAERHGLKVIEDCALATGAEFKGVKVGNRGDVAFYSSEQSKVFNTIEGGIATTNESNLAGRLQEYYSSAPLPDNKWIEKQMYNVILNYYQCKHSKRWFLGNWAELKYGKYRLISTTKEEEEGIKPAYYGRKMPAPISAIGLNQLKKIDRYNEIRRQTAFQWDKWCEENGYQKPLVIKDSIPIFLRYPVLVEPEKKRDTSWAKRELRVKLGVWFVSHIHPVNWPVEGCPNADRAVKQCINFPCLIE